MRIETSNVGMESARSYQASKTSVRRFSIMEYRQGSLEFNGNGLNAAVAGGQNDAAQAQQTQKEQQADTASEKRLYTVEDWRKGLEGVSRSRVNLRPSRSESMMDDFRQETIRYIFDILFAGRRNRMNRWNAQSGADNPIADNAGSTSAQTTGSAAGADIMNVGQGKQVGEVFGVNMRALFYSEEQMNFEQENTSFSTVGTVRTADGREINFNVDIGMSRQFQETFRQDLQLSAFSMCDPLVINLDTDVAELSDQKFFFDIDADGVEDEISMLNSGSGYLALDKNGDGVINDGSELFGTASGDGFADLAKYDEDGNGWIDENDAIWSKLQIWCKGADGKDVLYRLADKGVGAICLQRAATDFTLQGAQGQTNGAIRSTGVFLYENGNVGTVQHVDVAKYEQGA